MPRSSYMPRWTVVAPVAALALVGAGGAAPTGALAIGTAVAVLAAVHHAEVVAHRLGEPLGTLVLALAVTVIEVALIVSIMFAGGDPNGALARDTVFAAVMIILNGIVGLCMLIGGSRHREQRFTRAGASAALATLAALSVLTLVLPNTTTSTPGPTYAPSQLAFVGVVSLVLYGVFVLAQTVRHRDYFLIDEPAASPAASRPAAGQTWASGALLVVALVAVVLLAKALAPAVEAAVDAAGLPRAAVGVAIAGLVLLPEGLAAARAAAANRLQTSLNLAMGSALATIGLTIPAVAAVSLATGWTLTLGLDDRGVVLLALSLLVAGLSFSTGRTTVVQGAVHLVIFGAFLLTTLVP